MRNTLVVGLDKVSDLILRKPTHEKIDYVDE